MDIEELSIIDPFSKSDQPMSDDTKNVISFNGEIYNFREIKKQLQEGGAVFRTESDTEVILAAYQKWNLGCFQRFTGMFAIALWDYKNKSLILARDRFGEKPLFYYMGKDNELFFASEIKALLILPQLGLDLNTDAPRAVFYTQLHLNRRLFTKEYKKTSSCFVYAYSKNKDPIFKTYWNLANYYHDKNNISVNDASQKLSEMLDASIKNQLISDVPIGAFLSGGIDSASIVAGASLQLKEKKIDTFSIGFEEDTYSELSDAKETSQLLKTNHFDEIVKNNLIKDIQETSKILDEPMADNFYYSLFPLVKVCCTKSKSCIVRRWS